MFAILTEQNFSWFKIVKFSWFTMLVDGKGDCRSGLEKCMVIRGSYFWPCEMVHYFVVVTALFIWAVMAVVFQNVRLIVQLNFNDNE